MVQNREEVLKIMTLQMHFQISQVFSKWNLITVIKENRIRRKENKKVDKGEQNCVDDVVLVTQLGKLHQFNICFCLYYTDFEYYALFLGNKRYQ